MTYDERQEELLRFCTEPKSRKQIVEHFNIGTQAVYGCVRKLKESGHLNKMNEPGKPNGHGVTYQWTGKPYHVVKHSEPQYVKGVTVMGVRL